MTRQPNELKKRSGAELRAAAAVRQQQADPAFEANRREASFLANLSRAQSDFEWIAENQAWTLLGHDSLAEWWGAKVQPVMSALSMRLSPEMATKVIEKVKAAEAHLPASQRRSARDLAALVGTSDWTARGRQDRDKRRDADHPDLETPLTDPLDAIPAAQDAVDAFLADQSTPADRDPEASLETSAVATTGQPEVDRPGPVDLGDEDGAATPSDAQPSVPSVLASSSGEATGTGVASQHSEPVERQQGRAGVPAPAAAPGKTFDEVLDEFVPDGDPHRLWRSTWLKAIKNAWGPASFAVADIAANGDDNTFAALIDIRDFYDELLTKVQAERIRIAEAADADLPDNVRPIRRTA